MLFECTSPPPSSPGQCQYDSPPDVVHAQHAESPHRPSLLTKAKMSTALLPFLTRSSAVWLVKNIQMTPQTKLGWPSSRYAWFIETPASRQRRGEPPDQDHQEAGLGRRRSRGGKSSWCLINISHCGGHLRPLGSLPLIGRHHIMHFEPGILWICRSYPSLQTTQVPSGKAGTSSI